ncbi:acetyl-coenzyme A synthetase [Sulfurisphaera tokodaii]
MGYAKTSSRIDMDYFTLYQYSIENPEKYWSSFANKLEWFSKWNSVIIRDKYIAKWFVNGKTNIAYNSVNTHQGKALIWYGEDGKRIEITYDELNRLSNSIANLLKKRGIKKGMRIAIYSPNSILTLASILGTAKIGAIYTLIFAGLGIEAIKSRLNDFNPDLVISSRKTFRRGKEIPLLIEGDINFERNDEDEIRKLLDSDEVKVEEIEANEPLKVMYTSGTTGKPKGVILPHGAWMVGDYTVFDLLFGLKPGDKVLTTTDVGWITFSRIMYGTLLHGSTFIFMEGAPDYPKDRLVKIIEEEQPKVLFTSPTLIRLLMKYDIKLPRVEYIATAGEIFDEKSWNYALEIADKVTDVYGQSELGYVVGIPYSLESIKPKIGYAGVPFPGIVLDTLDDEGKAVRNKPGYLVAKTPFPTQFIGILNNEKKFTEYFEKFGFHDTGDLAIFDGTYIKIVGRADDMIKVAGHRITSGEVESIIASIDGVKDVAVVGIPDEIRGEKLAIFVVGKVDKEEIKRKVLDALGPIYIIHDVYVVEKLPKSRSGKTVRRILRDILLNKEIDASILEDPEVVKEIKDEIS